MQMLISWFSLGNGLPACNPSENTTIDDRQSPGSTTLKHLQLLSDLLHQLVLKLSCVAQSIPTARLEQFLQNTQLSYVLVPAAPTVRHAVSMVAFATVGAFGGAPLQVSKAPVISVKSPLTPSWNRRRTRRQVRLDWKSQATPAEGGSSSTMVKEIPLKADDIQPEHLYFSYGSNLSRNKMKTRGDSALPPIDFTDVWIGRLKDWSLCFNLSGAPPLEPCMGSIQTAPGDEVYGLVYRLKSDACWSKLLKSEGVTHDKGLSDSYHVVTVEVECYRSDQPSVKTLLLAKTLVTNPKYCLSRTQQELVRPSQRYMNLLIEGAKSEQLPEEYVQRLQNMRVARKWGPSPLLFLMTIAIPFIFMARMRKVRFLAHPLSKLGVPLYAAHEGLVRGGSTSVRARLQLILCKVALYVLYGFYVIPAVTVLLINPRGRRFYKMITSRARA